ncbi:FG-GAP-like repeat-containing protein [Microbacterium sp. PMB16]|uniref:FG-GAP-like repeat-containing protein n=1 Tax=Microbacterium sp. PMB16 TaxID=3120157 RepID=UPI003F4C9198
MRPSPRRRFIHTRRAIATALAVVLGAAFLAPAAASAAGGPAGEVFALTNAQRTKAGIPALKSDPGLDAAAAEWARHLAATCTFDHSSSAWRNSRVAAFGWIASGENIAAGQPDAPAVVAGWMNSSGHRANILDKRYTGLGVGYATGKCYRTYWVQIFGIGSPVKSLPGGTGDLTGDRAADVLARTSTGDLKIYPGNGAGGFKAATTPLPGWGSRPFTTLGDFSGDGVADVARTEADGRLMLYAGNGKGGFLAPVQIGTGWSKYSDLIGGIDFNGDRLPDVIGRTPTGDMILHRGNGRSGWTGGGTTIATRWASLQWISYAGDFTGDSRGDLIARKPDGTLWVYPTTGKGTWGTPKKISSGWQTATAIFGAGDFDGNGTQDIVARASTGALYLYGGTGRGGLLPRRTIGSGWAPFSQIG